MAQSNSDGESPKMITLTTVSWIGEADALCLQLEAFGIKTYMPDQGTVAVNPMYATAIGGIRIQIDEGDLPWHVRS